MRMLRKWAMTSLCTFVLFLISCEAQDSASSKKTVLYTVMLNHVNEEFKGPLIGFVNIGKGNQTGLQLGFVNVTSRHFSGGQIGFVNTAGGNALGAQIGFVNVNKDSLKGAQIGFFNVSGKQARGVQLSFMNIAGKGFSGTQISFLNIAGGQSKGFQMGFFNYAKKVSRGFHLGFINVIDSVGKGIPLGFLTVVRKGGYRAVELSSNEVYPFQLAIKTGVPVLYNIFSFGVNPWEKPFIGLGAGLGSIISLPKHFFLNPEVHTMGTLSNQSTLAGSFSFSAGYTLKQRVQFTIGPSVSHIYRPSASSVELDPAYHLYHHSFNDRNNLFLGVRLSTRYVF